MTYENLACVYLLKNKNIENKWLFVNNYHEELEIESENVKTLYMNECLNILQHNNIKIFVYFNGFCKLNSELKFKKVCFSITYIEIYDELIRRKMDINDLKNSFFSLYYKFITFLNVRFI